MTWSNKKAKRTIRQIPVLTAGEKFALKARIAEALRKAGLGPATIAWNMKVDIE